MSLICPIQRILPSECPNCGNHSISIYDRKDNRINYSLLCKYNSFEQIKIKLSKSDLKYMKCESCKSVFVLDWTRNEIPYPCTKEVYNKFEK